MENQIGDNSGDKTTINVQVPSLTNILSRRPFIPVLFALGILLFFLSFCDFSCSGHKIGSVTGINLVTGTELKSRDMFSGNETRGEKIPASIWAIFAFGAGIVGCAIYLIKDKREALIGTGAGAVGFIALIILQFAIKGSIDEKGQGQITTSFQFGYWAALISFGLAAFLSYLRIHMIPAISGNFVQPVQNESISQEMKSAPLESSALFFLPIIRWY